MHGILYPFICIVCRLHFLDTYKPAESQPEPDREYTMMTLPNKTSYKDIHDGMKETVPNVSRVDEYLAQFDKKLDPKIREWYNAR